MYEQMLTAACVVSIMGTLLTGRTLIQAWRDRNAVCAGRRSIVEHMFVRASLRHELFRMLKHLILTFTLLSQSNDYISSDFVWISVAAVSIIMIVNSHMDLNARNEAMLHFEKWN